MPDGRNAAEAVLRKAILKRTSVSKQADNLEANHHEQQKQAEHDEDAPPGHGCLAWPIIPVEMSMPAHKEADDQPWKFPKAHAATPLP